MFLSVRRLWADFRIARRAVVVSVAAPNAGLSPRGRAISRLVAQIGITTVVLTFALVQLSRPSLDAKTREWLTGLVGTLVGYWLR